MKGKPTNNKSTNIGSKTNGSKNNASMKKVTSNAPKGFGFADAMFGVKDILNEYSNYGEKQKTQEAEYQIPGVVPVQVYKQKKIQKAVILKKQPLKPTIPQRNKLQPECRIPQKQEHFKISSGKQFQENFEQVQLKIIRAQEHIFEITTNNRLSSWEYNLFCDGVSLSEMLPDGRVSFDFQATDVKQGGLGNCYFIASLASIAHLPMLLRERIPDFKKYTAKDKVFRVNLFESGKYLEFGVENLFPQIFVKPVGNDISLMILEKAYAQLYGNYKILNMGHACDSMRDLTGAPTEYLDIKDKNQLVAKIQIALIEKYPIVIASKVSVVQKDISPKHSYNIIDVNIGGNIYLKLRDPRGYSYLGYPSAQPISEQDTSNGMFWVDHEKLIENFEVITICKAKYGYNYLYKTFKPSQTSNNEGAMLMEVKKGGKSYITAHQKHKKFFDDKFSYHMIRIMIASVDLKNGKILLKKTIKADFSVKQVVTIQHELEPGHYVIFTKFGSSQKIGPKITDDTLTVSVYTEIPAESLNFSLLKSKNIQIEPYILNYMRNHRQQFKESISDKKLYRYFGAFYGFMCMYYENNSNLSVREELNFDATNIKITETKLSLSPGAQKVLLFPLGEKNNCSHKFAFKTKTTYKN